MLPTQALTDCYRDFFHVFYIGKNRARFRTCTDFANQILASNIKIFITSDFRGRSFSQQKVNIGFLFRNIKSECQPSVTGFPVFRTNYRRRFA